MEQLQLEEDREASKYQKVKKLQGKHQCIYTLNTLVKEGHEAISYLDLSKRSTADSSSENSNNSNATGQSASWSHHRNIMPRLSKLTHVDLHYLITKDPMGS